MKRLNRSKGLSGIVRHAGLIAAWTASLYLAFPAQAWNGTGHRIVAAIAYQKLTPKVRARVDALLRSHPDYATLLTRGAPADAAGHRDPAALAREAFLAAAVWPDTIRGDNRFYDDTRPNAQPTPLLPGFSDMARHTNWHYLDVPFAPDGATPEPAPTPNALMELQRLLPEIHSLPKDSPKIAYDIPWIEHLVGDVHQPLHCTSRFLKVQPKGDAGGNGVIVAPNRTLHALWDDAAGSDTGDEYVTKYAAEAIAQNPARKISKDPKKWIDESFKLDKSDVYTFGLEVGSRDHPLALPAGYEENAKRVARQRIALAGYRLAAVLNERLK